MASVFRRRSLNMRVVGLLAMMGAACAEPTAADAGRIDEIFASVNNRQSPGCVAATLRGGVVEFAQGYGMADLEHATPITTFASTSRRSRRTRRRSRSAS
jgi:hypothetical protein